MTPFQAVRTSSNEARRVDASCLNGLGFVLKQQHADNRCNMVQAGSRFLSDVETRYAMIELECLSAAWVMKKCHQFIEGLDTFELVSDHKPLVPILNDYSLDKLDNCVYGLRCSATGSKPDGFLGRRISTQTLCYEPRSTQQFQKMSWMKEQPHSPHYLP